MAIYKIFPTKDATIYSSTPDKNTGLDEILETSTTVDISNNPQTSRYLIHFSTTEINNLLNNQIQDKLWKANLKGYVARLEGLNTDTILEAFPISGSWNMGTGKYLYNPQYTNGVSWKFRNSSGSGAWESSSFDIYVTASFNNEPGGGNWYISSSNNTIIPIFGTQSFTYSDSGDINIDVTNMVKGWYSESIYNDGIIVKQRDEFIDDPNYQILMRFFSIDTHTIYPPCLEFRWDDYLWNTGSSSKNIINNPNSVISISNNPGFFYSGSINKFTVNARPKFPIRTFQTSSVYINNYYLPTSSCYAVKDLDTNEFVIDFDDIYTKISADDNSNYFTIYMNGLEPERYYKILIKSVINGSTVIFDENYYFKIING